ncbi:UpxY family transcription antiterminator [Flavobacterium sp. DGU11]|uniref:UpxY family transcription antiterminator n=1 Tax=Flavobacterium arundinis TaxID=3139143 RepID=A0ABU9HUM2_9FLAO
MPWHVVYTKPKAEKKVSEELAAMGIEVYCPLVSKIRQWSDRKKKVEMPLFTSYVFVNIEEKRKNDVFHAKGVVRYLFWLGKPALVRDTEIEEIKKWLHTDVTDVEVENIQKGDLFEIKEGPFKNHSGLVEEVNKNTIRLKVESIGVMLTIKYNTPADTGKA